MPQEQEFYVIVHPSIGNNEYPDANARAQEVWRLWGWQEEAVGQFYPALHVLRGWDALIDTGYFDELPSGTRIIIGGQVTDVCVSIHAEHIVLHPRVKEFTIAFDRKALVGSDQGPDKLVVHLQERGISASVRE